MKQYDLHERLIDFAVMIIDITDNLKTLKQEIICQGKLFVLEQRHH